VSQWIEDLVKARFLVASLGEGASPPWWRSQATGEIGLRMLERLFPRTAVTAGLELASRAARLEHDARIGRGGVYHLFRLPSGDEAAVLDLVGRAEADAILRELAAGDREGKLQRLSELADGVGARDGSGPVYRGPIQELRRGGALRAVCAVYERAFRSEQPVYPYLGEQPA